MNRRGARRRRRDCAAAQLATAREVEVVAAYLAGGSEKAAAHQLGLSERTVQNHFANARSRTGAPSRAHLVWILADRIEAALP